VIWTAVGGRGTLIGPLIGGIVVNAGKTLFTGVWPDYWLFALGGLFILVTLFLPKGIVGTIRDAFRRKAPPRADNTEPEETGAKDVPLITEPAE
jgi:urea transport system permease protein